MRNLVVRTVIVGAIAAGGLALAAGTASAEAVDCGKAQHGYNWALANLGVADSYFTQAYYRGFEDYYAGQLDAGNC
jgi:hypothetical protein